jgi:hypothetical protein
MFMVRFRGHLQQASTMSPENAQCGAPGPGTISMPPVFKLFMRLYK